MQMYGGILDASKYDMVNNIAGYPNYKQISQTLIKNYLRRNPGICAAKNHCERMLSTQELGTMYGSLIWIGHASARMAGVTSL
jgi:hypothetical protein